MKRHMGTHTRKRPPSREVIYVQNRLVVVKDENQDGSLPAPKEENLKKEIEAAGEQQLEYDSINTNNLETRDSNTLYVMPVLIT